MGSLEKLIEAYQLNEGLSYEEAKKKAKQNEQTPK